MATAIILHQYLLHAHMNGRMIDIWRRLNASEQDFFVPHDLEVSAAELHYACQRAKRWRGAGGARREVILHDFQVNEDEAVANTTSGAGGGIDGTAQSGMKQGGSLPTIDRARWGKIRTRSTVNGRVQRTTQKAIATVPKSDRVLSYNSLPWS